MLSACRRSRWLRRPYPRSLSSAAARLGARLEEQLDAMRAQGTLKSERVIGSPIQPEMQLAAGGPTVLNFCANNYLGLSNHPRLVEAAGRYLKS